jgi:predicted RNA binding protein YcfA (HicA-like mRNA interferase family)
MAELPVLSGQKIVKALETIGYAVMRQRGSHVRLYHKSRKPVTVPNYPSVSRGLLRKILRDAELSPDNFLGLL